MGIDTVYSYRTEEGLLMNATYFHMEDGGMLMAGRSIAMAYGMCENDTHDGWLVRNKKYAWNVQQQPHCLRCSVKVDAHCALCPQNNTAAVASSILCCLSM